MKKIAFKLNGEEVTAEVLPGQTLVEMIRETFRLTGTKEGCGTGDCGACTVWFNGKPVNSCLVLAEEVNGQEITTIEGVARDGKLHPLQQSFVDHGSIQCGFCTPGMIMTGLFVLRENPHPTELEVRHAIAGNICRCTGYDKIVKAILAAADQ